MARGLRRTAALSALFRAFSSAARGGPSVGERLSAFPRMVGATIRGKYDGAWRLAMMAGALAYIVSPIDLVPEAFLLIFGLADDALVATWLAGAVLSETERFLDWERRTGTVIPSKVIHK